MSTYEVLLHVVGIEMLDAEGRCRIGGAYIWRAVKTADARELLSLARRRTLNDAQFISEVRNSSLEELEFFIDEVRDSDEGNETAPIFYIDED